jgi:WD40 repeat protein
MPPFPDGRTLVYNSEGTHETGGGIALWDTSARASRVIAGDGWAKDAVAFFPDSKTVATPAGRGMVALCDVASGQRKATLSGGGEDVLIGLAFSPDGRILAAATDTSRRIREVLGPKISSSLTLWDVAAGTKLVSTSIQISRFDYHWIEIRSGERRLLPSFFRGLKFGPDGRQLVSTNDGGFYLRHAIWSAADLQPLTVTGAHEPAFSPDGQVVAVPDDDEFSAGLSFLTVTGQTASGKKELGVSLLDVETLQERARLEARWSSSIDAPVFSPDGRLVVASGSFLPIRWTELNLNEVKIWDTATGREVVTLHRYRAPLFSPDGQSLVAVCGGEPPFIGGSITVWDVPVPTRTWRLAGVVFVWTLLPILALIWFLARRRKSTLVVRS